MNILVINCGSSSVKYDIIDTIKESTLLQGQCAGLNSKNSFHRYTKEGTSHFEELPISDHKDAIHLITDFLTDEGYITDEGPKFQAIGHRVVHGGEKFSDAVIITPEVRETIESLIPLAPLHNPVNLLGIDICQKLFPKIKQVAVFDTAFHQSMPPRSYRYAIPEKWFKDFGIRKYGFHGTSHDYVSQKAALYLKDNRKDLRMVSCHLGNGASLCAILNGISYDTTMGFSPLEGLIMGTRSGDIDPAVIQFLHNEKKIPINDIINDLNKESGLLGLSQKSSNMVDLLKGLSKGDESSALAVSSFVHRITRYIGGYMAEMGGTEVIIFTGGIGENAPLIRERISQKLDFAGAVLDDDLNYRVDSIMINDVAQISAPHSRIKILVIKTDEEMLIAQHSALIIQGKSVLPPERIPIPIGISARHMHLSRDHVDILFGKDHQLTPIFDLSQPGQFACEETVSVKGPKGEIKKIRILGPERSKTQIEISRTDEFKLGIDAPIRASGNVEESPGAILTGSAGSLELKEGVICALRHIHMSPADARALNVENGDLVKVEVDGPRELTFGDVLVRVKNTYRLEMHIDTDEANSAELSGSAVGFIVGIQDTRDING